MPSVTTTGTRPAPRAAPRVDAQAQPAPTSAGTSRDNSAAPTYSWATAAPAVPTPLDSSAERVRPIRRAAEGERASSPAADPARSPDAGTGSTTTREADRGADPGADRGTRTSSARGTGESSLASIG